MVPYFIFNNIDSKDYLIINKLPSIFKAERNIEKIEVEGRDGFLTIDDETYKGAIKSVECTIKDLKDIDFLCNWLNGGGEVIFSNEPEKIYKAVIINQIEFKKVFVNFHSFLIQFEVQPHKYSIGNEIITLESVGTIFNSGSANSKPIIKVFGTGAITLVVNGFGVVLTNVIDYVTIDSDLQDAYKDSLLMNNYMTGEFSELIPGTNTISWTGTVSRLEIIPNFRWL